MSVPELADLFVEMADELPLVELVVLGDWMLRRKGMTHKRLARAIETASGSRAARAHQALGYVRGKVDSPIVKVIVEYDGRVHIEREGLDGLPARPGDDWRPHFPGHRS